MKEAEGSVNEQLDRIIARVCQESGLVEWLDGQKQGKRKPEERWNATEGRYVTD